MEDGVVIAVAAALILLSLHLNDIPLPRVLLSRCIAPDCRWVFKVLALSTACCCILASCNLRAMYKGRLLHFWNYAPPSPLSVIICTIEITQPPLPLTDDVICTLASLGRKGTFDKIWKTYITQPF